MTSELGASTGSSSAGVAAGSAGFAAGRFMPGPFLALALAVVFAAALLPADFAFPFAFTAVFGLASALFPRVGDGSWSLSSVTASRGMGCKRRQSPGGENRSLNIEPLQVNMKAKSISHGCFSICLRHQKRRSQAASILVSEPLGLNPRGACRTSQKQTLLFKYKDYCIYMVRNTV